MTGATGHVPTCAKISKDSKFIGVGYSNDDVVILHNTAPFNVYFVRPTGFGIIVALDFNTASDQFVSCHKLKRLKTWSLPATGAVNGTQSFNL
jgi:hypothetical protein